MTYYLWLGIAAIAGAVEAFSLSLLTMWFVLGGIAAFFAGLAGASEPLQIAVFLAVSISTFVGLRPVALKYRTRKTAADPTPVGQVGRVVKAIGGSGRPGRVLTPDQVSWVALSADGSPIETDAQVRVVDHQSIKLIVERI
ncbi:NfeD family protein [Eggerthellaceae bacterium zg-1084]|uniref:NfeD family protein n=1 Tax=Berryella wangjianweii TaxID=2734634 RepID=A0A6M8J5V5_9ACTN|nr:NfeD family protein [Berryella wangjianweii]NPD31308.1 NfeD family protein [Berryella wangjianweii]NPD32383.1 NfeD family protein [Eggerthellaceae bacterium zg-997]QKF06849.1 NfeD family protein [Berryella wangjianweii]